LRIKDLRNSIVHGFSRPSAKELLDATNHLQKIIDQLAAPSSAAQ
jgi:hypothetical protein